MAEPDQNEVDRLPDYPTGVLIAFMVALGLFLYWVYDTLVPLIVFIVRGWHVPGSL